MNIQGSVFKISRSFYLHFSNVLFLSCLVFLFIYFSGLNNNFFYFSPGSDSDLFIDFLRIINSERSSYLFSIFMADKKSAHVELIAPIFNVVEPGSFSGLLTLIIINAIFLAIIIKRITSLTFSNEVLLINSLIILCPLTAMLMASYLRDIFALFLVIEIAYLIHVWRNKFRNVLFLLLFSFLLYYTRSFYLFAIISGYIFSRFKFKYVVILFFLSIFAIVNLIDLKPLLLRLLLLHGEDAARFSESSLAVRFEDINSISPVLVLKRVALGFLTMVATPQPAFVLQDIISGRGSTINLFENILQLVYSIFYIAFLLPITFTIISKRANIQSFIQTRSMFHDILLFVLFSVLFIYSVKFFGIRHYKVEYVKYVLWLASLSYFPILSNVRTKRFLFFSILCCLMAFLLVAMYLI